MPLDPQRYRAPKADGAVLAVPPLDEADALLAANAERLRGWDHDFQGRDAARLRSMARAQLLRLAAEHHRAHGLDLPAAPEPSAPWVLTGHQPELFHPGVWVKNFAVAGVAGRCRAVGLNLIVDNDIPKSAAIRVPTGSGCGSRGRGGGSRPAGGPATGRSPWAGPARPKPSATSPATCWPTCPATRRSTTGPCTSTGGSTRSAARTTPSPTSGARGTGSKRRSGPGGPSRPAAGR